MRMSAYEAPSDRAFSRATLPSVSSRSGAGYAASARRTTKAPGTISKAARASADAPQDLRNSLRLGPCTDRLLEPAGGADTPPPPPRHAALQESARTQFSASISAPLFDHASAGVPCERPPVPRQRAGPPLRDARATPTISG